MRTLFKNARVLRMIDRTAVAAERLDVLVEGGRIREVGTQIAADHVDRLIDGTHLLLMPGMVNAHIHTEQNTFRGRYRGLPLEILSAAPSEEAA